MKDELEALWVLFFGHAESQNKTDFINCFESEDKGLDDLFSNEEQNQDLLNAFYGGTNAA